MRFQKTTMDFLNTLLPTIENVGVWAYWIVLLASFIESLAFIGLVIPGSVIIIFAGFVASRGILDIGDLIWFVAIGAILGYDVSFYLGRKGILFLRKHDKIFKDEHLVKSEAFFKKYGGKSIFFGRFMGPIRPVIPFVAGLFRMDIKIFFWWNIASAFSFAIIFLAAGYFLGGAWYLFQKWFTIGEYMIVAIISAITIFFAWRWFFFKQKQ